MFQLMQFPANGGDPNNHGDQPPENPKARSRPRTHRACDVCRQMKIKCDGATPCRHCSHSFQDCTYSESKRKRKRASTPQRTIRELENRLKAVEESCKKLAADRTPSVITSPTTITVGSTPSMAFPEEATIESSGPEPRAPMRNPEDHPQDHPGQTQGEARFLGSSADRAFVERLKAELGEWPGADYESRLSMRNRPGPKLFPQRSTSPAPLPPFKRAEKLVNLALDEHILYQVIHRPSFDCTFQLLFSLDKLDHGEHESALIPLVYSLMALGAVLEKHDNITMDIGNEALAEGTRYFNTCRDMLDLGDCYDYELITLQTIFYMNLFLTATASMNSCYTYLCHAMSLAFRMNLHQPTEGDDKITAEVKSRLFWSLKQLLVAVASVTGHPRLIGDTEIDLPYPEDEIHDMGITNSIPQDRPALVAPGFLPFIKLHTILDKVVKTLYPSTGTRRGRTSDSRSHCVSNETIMTLENELQKWADSLPKDCILGANKRPAYLERANYEIYVTYCNVQVFLYRPFLHYLLEENNHNGQSRKEFQKYAAACIRASSTIIQLGEDMYRNGLLYGAQWKVLHVIFTSALSLLYVLLGRKGSSTAATALVDVNTAKSLLGSLRPYSVRAQRAHLALTVLTTVFSNRPTSSHSNGLETDCAERPTPEVPAHLRTAKLGEKALRLSSHEYEDDPLNVDGASDSAESESADTQLPATMSFVRRFPQPQEESQQPSRLQHGDGDISDTINPRQEATISSTLSTPAPLELPPLPVAMAPDTGVSNPEPPFNENTYYLEARPFTLPQNTESENDFFQFLGGDVTDFDGIMGNLAGFGGGFPSF